MSRKECVGGLFFFFLNVKFIEIKGKRERGGRGLLASSEEQQGKGVWMGIVTARGLCLKLKEDLFDINVKAVCEVFAKNEQRHTRQNNCEMFSTRDARAVRQELSH